MTQERAPARTQSLLGDEAETTSWEVARARLANPEQSRTSWLATTRPDGRPHLMPVIAFWIDGAMHIVAGKGRKRHATSPRMVDAPSRPAARRSHRSTSSSRVAPSRSPIMTPFDRSPSSSRRRAGPSRPRGDKVEGPNAPTAGPSPYTIFRIVPSRVFGLPGMTGMEQFDPGDLPKPTRWDFGGS